MKCVLAGCDRKIDPKWCLCGDHFRIIPEHLRAPLSRAYSPTHELAEQGPGFHKALAKVQGWIVATFGAQVGPEHKDWNQLVKMVRERDAARAAANGRPAPPESAASTTSADEPADEPAPPAQMRLL